ncbi:MAG: ferritin-like domain-containing protein, partial [Chloroflexota bacterium]|nr:ferritin-like domain-containing protein [Chloroflexota bacterium]
TFTVPDEAILTDVPIFLTTLVSLEEAFIAAYIAAAQVFAIRGEARLVQVALQIGAIEAEHRAGARFFAIEAGILTGTPNDVAFEQALFTSVGQAATALTDLGFIGGSGTEISYPGPGAIDTSGVTNLAP